MARIMIACIRCYQRWLLPLVGQHCRFYPTCSQYAIDAIQTHGVIFGWGYAIWRILRCQPLCKGGFDPVPPRRGQNAHRDHTAP